MNAPFNAAQPAFPHSRDVIRDGLTKREYFAGLAMQGYIARGNAYDAPVVAQRCAELADALLAELAK